MANSYHGVGAGSGMETSDLDSVPTAALPGSPASFAGRPVECGDHASSRPRTADRPDAVGRGTNEPHTPGGRIPPGHGHRTDDGAAGGVRR